jgi:hypothetical protein
VRIQPSIREDVRPPLDKISEETSQDFLPNSTYKTLEEKPLQEQNSIDLDKSLPEIKADIGSQHILNEVGSSAVEFWNTEFTAPLEQNYSLSNANNLKSGTTEDAALEHSSLSRKPHGPSKNVQHSVLKEPESKDVKMDLNSSNLSTRPGNTINNFWRSIYLSQHQIDISEQLETPLLDAGLPEMNPNCSIGQTGYNSGTTMESFSSSKHHSDRKSKIKSHSVRQTPHPKMTEPISMRNLRTNSMPIEHNFRVGNELFESIPKPKTLKERVASDTRIQPQTHDASRKIVTKSLKSSYHESRPSISSLDSSKQKSVILPIDEVSFESNSNPSESLSFQTAKPSFSSKKTFTLDPVDLEFGLSLLQEKERQLQKQKSKNQVFDSTDDQIFFELGHSFVGEPIQIEESRSSRSSLMGPRPEPFQDILPESDQSSISGRSSLHGPRSEPLEWSFDINIPKTSTTTKEFTAMMKGSTISKKFKQLIKQMGSSFSADESFSIPKVKGPRDMR